MGFLDEWAGNWKKALNSVAASGDSMKKYLDENDYRFRDRICFEIKVEDLKSAAVPWEDITISNIGDKINSYINPSPTNKSDYEYVKRIFNDKKDLFIGKLSKKFDLNTAQVRGKLNSWPDGVGIPSLFYEYYYDDINSLKIIKRMQINKYHIENSWCNSFGEFAVSMRKDSSTQKVW